MLNTKRRPFIATALLLTSLGVTTSCIDNSYDLNKDIDMTVNVGGEHLAIPVGYTEQITLDKIIELDEGDDLQLVNGEYHLLKSDKIDETNTSVKMVTVNESSNPINSINVLNNVDYSQPGDVTVEDIKSEGSVNTEAHGIDEAVIEIGSLTANTPAKLTLSFEINKTNSISYSDVTIDKMTITFPDFIKFEEGQSGLNGQVLTISNETLSSSTYTIDLYISKYVFGEKYGDGNKVKEENGDRIIKIENQKITVKTDVTVHQAQGTGSLSITPTAILAAMTVSEVNGTIKPDMDVKPTEVELTNLPDFLQDEEVKLDRQAELMELQQDISAELGERRIGQELLVMIEGKVADEDAYVGRSQADAPGVDGYVFVNTPETLVSGDFVRVKITGALEYDLIGEISQ